MLAVDMCLYFPYFRLVASLMSGTNYANRNKYTESEMMERVMSVKEKE